ncbi:MAG: hypothetical protein LBE78_09205 [Burkholderiaceae bacterium]|jgi:hypothetical protein|nr:hypothetical protein [Burkholderiaceae bacterium]
MIRNIIIFFSLINLSFYAMPCSFAGLEHEIEFEPQSAALGIKNAKTLTEWFIKWRDGVGVGSIAISATSIENDPYSATISHERMRNIAQIIKPLNKQDAPIDEFYERGPVPVSSPLAFRSNFAFIVVQPACLKTNTCCSMRIPE